MSKEKLKEKIKMFFSLAKEKIAILERFKDLSGEDKKQRLDIFLYDVIEDTMDKLGLNIVLRWAVRKLVLDNLSVITQAIFDLIKAKVEGVTEIWTPDTTEAANG